MFRTLTAAAIAARDSVLDTPIEPIAPFTLADLTSEAGWTELPSGLLYRIEREGKGDAEKVGRVSEDNDEEVGSEVRSSG